jgi:hypothetical protein
VLVFVNRNDRAEPYRVYVYPTEADVEPCVPVKPTPDRSQRACCPSGGVWPLLEGPHTREAHAGQSAAASTWPNSPPPSPSVSR